MRLSEAERAIANLSSNQIRLFSRDDDQARRVSDLQTRVTRWGIVLGALVVAWMGTLALWGVLR